MDKKPVFELLPEKMNVGLRAPRGMGRREAVRRLLAGAGGALMVPGLAAAHPVHKHLADAATLAAADFKAAAADWTPEYLDAHQNETLVALSERIIPGSNKAQVNRFIDLLLTVDTEDSQKKFLASLGAFDGDSMTRFGHPYVALTEDQQNKILDAASTEKPGSGGDENGMGFTPPANPPTEPLRITMRDHFENLKGWISGAYYSSEIGMRELGWTGENFYESFPGCEHSEGHH
ncbi:MAG TPA: gluconate 2-dehydrogenase subunit 3 family protein [Terriglobia bacterium]|nr:gluconate 2-dehydrogenase subunit 3 family protein [Terriglobia bacterium]